MLTDIDNLHGSSENDKNRGSPVPDKCVIEPPLAPMGVRKANVHSEDIFEQPNSEDSLEN